MPIDAPQPSGKTSAPGNITVPNVAWYDVVFGGKTEALTLNAKCCTRSPPSAILTCAITAFYLMGQRSQHCFHACVGQNSCKLFSMLPTHGVSCDLQISHLQQHGPQTPPDTSKLHALLQQHDPSVLFLCLTILCHLQNPPWPEHKIKAISAKRCTRSPQKSHSPMSHGCHSNFHLSRSRTCSRCQERYRSGHAAAPKHQAARRLRPEIRTSKDMYNTRECQSGARRCQLPLHVTSA